MFPIETERLILRGFLESDLNDYHARIYSDPDVTRYLPTGKPRPIEGTKAVLDFALEHGLKHGFTLWAVIDKSTGQFIGHCGLVYLKNGTDVEIAYAYGKEFWGKGIGVEAAQATLKYGFEVTQLPRILALAVPENVASQRIMQKIGMVYQGISEQYYDTPLALYTAERGIWLAKTAE